VEKQEQAAGKEILLEQVLLVSDGDKTEIGQPLVKGAEVQAKVLEQTKGEKTVAFKYRRRKSSHTKIGHRQQLTKLEIKEIKL
jgi:large subunit ribosomal protein L21